MIFPVEPGHSVDFIPGMTIVLIGRSEAEVEKDRREMRKAMRKIAATPKSARTFLRKHGFITKNNKLTKRYR